MSYTSAWFHYDTEHPRERAGMTHKVVVLALSEKPARTGIVPSAFLPLAGAGTPRPLGQSLGAPLGQGGLSVCPLGLAQGTQTAWKADLAAQAWDQRGLRDSQDLPARGPSPRKGRGGCRAAPWWPPRTYLCLCPAAMDGPGVGQDAMKNCTDQEYWDTLVSLCIPCSLACGQSLARKCDAVCGECWVPCVGESGMGPSWEGGSEPGML